ncbi:growth hormone-inducible transmembrane protein [Haematobia irritans]|uniref:Putative growth hormone-induced protein n=1 Tax=Haematobia irritans TaxID=7368 RepID=A0A1L8EEQ8_HAEIR
MILRLASALPAKGLLTNSFSSSAKQAFLAPRLIKPANNNNVLLRNYARGPREAPPTVRGEVRRGPTLKERLMAPPSANAYSLGKGAAAGAAGVGLGALCYYGLGLSNDASIQHNSLLWPQYVRDRLHTTYGYFGAACTITALSAAAVFRSPRLLELTTRNGWMSTLGTFALVIGTGAMTQSIQYKEGVGPKQLSWLLHCAVLGGVIAPLCFLGGPLLTRAAIYTGGVVGGLSTVAVCAPSDKFLYMGGPLAIGLGLVMASSLAGIWLPPTTALGAGLASLSLYGGLILFSGFLLYDTQRIVRKAEMHPQYAMQPFDPINASLSIYMDALNIFIRIAMILAGGGGNNRRK